MSVPVSGAAPYGLELGYSEIGQETPLDPAIQYLYSLKTTDDTFYELYSKSV
jgi:hypothetical protein